VISDKLVQVKRKLNSLNMWLDIRLLSHTYEKNMIGREESILCAFQIT